MPWHTGGVVCERASGARIALDAVGVRVVLRHGHRAAAGAAHEAVDAHLSPVDEQQPPARHHVGVARRGRSQRVRVRARRRVPRRLRGTTARAARERAARERAALARAAVVGGAVVGCAAALGCAATLGRAALALASLMCAWIVGWRARSMGEWWAVRLGGAREGGRAEGVSGCREGAVRGGEGAGGGCWQLRRAQNGACGRGVACLLLLQLCSRRGTRPS